MAGFVGTSLGFGALHSLAPAQLVQVLYRTAVYDSPKVYGLGGPNNHVRSLVACGIVAAIATRLPQSPHRFLCARTGDIAAGVRQIFGK